MSSQLAGTGLQTEIERVGQVQQLAARITACMVGADDILGNFRDIQLLQWQSPAGQAYRNSVALQAGALNRALEALREAQSAVQRHSRETLTAGCTYLGGM